MYYTTLQTWFHYGNKIGYKCKKSYLCQCKGREPLPLSSKCPTTPDAKKSKELAIGGNASATYFFSYLQYEPDFVQFYQNHCKVTELFLIK